MRAARRGVDIEPRLRELKDLVLEEQGEMRKFIGVLRHGRQIPARELADEMRVLASKLSRQWGADCTLDADLPDTTFPMRLHLDAQHLVREGVANAARHAGASCIAIRLSIEDGALQLQMINDGRGLPPDMSGSAAGETTQPWSLKERIEHAGGRLTLASSLEATTVYISLPIDGPGL